MIEFCLCLSLMREPIVQLFFKRCLLPLGSTFMSHSDVQYVAQYRAHSRNTKLFGMCVLKSNSTL